LTTDDRIAQAGFETRWVRPATGARPASGNTPPAARVSRFLQRDFIDAALREPAEPVFSESDLASARQEGFDAGHAAGMAAAAASRAAACAAAEIQALGIFSAAMADARREAARVTDLAADALARTLLAAMEAVMPDLIRRSALSEVGAMLARVLPGLPSEPAVRIEVPSEIADSISSWLASMPSEQRSNVTLIGQDTMRPGDARVSWAAGQARRQPAGVWHSVMEALQPVLTHPSPHCPDPAHPEKRSLEGKDCNNE
jgi:flagellar assembly protein FliH